MLAHDVQLDRARIGLVVPKKNIRLAVHRNLFKRLVRETFRKKKAGLQALDIVVLAKKDVYDLSPRDRDSVFNTMFDKLQIVETNKNPETNE